VLDGLRLAVGTLTVLPVGVPRADHRVAGRAMTWAPAVGAVLGALAGLTTWLGTTAGLGSLLAAVAAVATLAVLTRGLHLDGLADTADGLGSAAPPDEALRIMKSSDIGPFGVVTLALVLLAQVAALAQLRSGEAVAALVISAATGRLAVTLACRRGLRAARREGLGALVAGTVAPTAAAAATLATLLAAAGVALLGGLTAAGAARAALAVGAGLAAALALLAHCRRRLGGVTGDVLGALVETGTTGALLVMAAG
jgi:adenosylcobinamide-GDP ribazoletransferase